MIKIACTAADTLLLSHMTPFQGEAKKRSKEDLETLSGSIRNEGLLQPISVWPDENKRYHIIDGHGRYAALISLALEDPSILQQEIPVSIVVADTHEDAVKACLQCMSTCGKINKPGLLAFSSTVVGYRAPVLVKATHIVATRERVTQQQQIIVRLRVDRDKVAQLTALLKDVQGVEVL